MIQIDKRTKSFNYVGVLAEVSPESAAGILEDCPTFVLHKEDELFASGASNSSLYLLLDGELHVDFEGESESPIHLFRGETVGEMSVIDGSPTSARVYAAKDSTLLQICSDDFWRLINASHQFSMNMLRELSRRVRKDNRIIQEGAEERQQLIAHSVLDPMTSLYNRRWLTENGERILNRFKIGKLPLSVMMLDIDHFKNVNDTYGHQAGDTILEQVAMIIKNVIRPTDFAIRYGGEEFLVFLTDTPFEEAFIPANRLRTAIEKTTLATSVPNKLPSVTISCGIGTLSKSTSSIQELIESADKKLYEAKESGRNLVCG